MLTTAGLAGPAIETVNPVLPARLGETAQCEMMTLLERGFGVKFTILDGHTGELLLSAPHQLLRDWSPWSEICCAVARRRRPEFIAEHDPLILLALPLMASHDESYVAVSMFLSRELRGGESLAAVATALGLSADELTAWAVRQTAAHPGSLQRLAELALAEWSARQRIRKLEAETQTLSNHLATTYEEISLLHRLTHNLKLSRSDEELGRIALEWLAEVMPAKLLALQFLPSSEEGKAAGRRGQGAPVLLTEGERTLENGDFLRLVGHLGGHIPSQPAVFNRKATSEQSWPLPQVRQLIAVPLAEGENLFGWLLAINHRHDGEFGSVEASLLGSVGAILGIHSGNIELYRQQSELLASMVRALTSAIDAKDPYTCGHSDRVARIAVCLAEELGLQPQAVQTVYLSGLLHDIGKIGINDAVLRKPGKLTDSEYEHIKRHVEIGHKILRDLKKLGDVLPVVLHHHESWDGRGYPSRLQKDSIPQIARIIAVADSYDAMASNRPYRNGMPDDKIDDILRAGAAKQWDPAIVDAFFRARNTVRRIVRNEAEAADEGRVELPRILGK